MDNAAFLILNLEITTQVLQRFTTTEEDLAALHARPDTWVSLAVLKVVDDEDLVAEHLQEALQFPQICVRTGCCAPRPVGRQHLQDSLDGSQAPVQRQEPCKRC